MAEKQYSDEMRGTLWENMDRKGKQPVFSGHLKIKGQKIFVSAWTRFSPRDRDQRIVDLVLETEEDRKRRQEKQGTRSGNRRDAQQERNSDYRDDRRGGGYNSDDVESPPW